MDNEKNVEVFVQGVSGKVVIENDSDGPAEDNQEEATGTEVDNSQ
jgi:hypothetical protein